MAYTLGNKCAKNLCKRIVLLQLIIENVITCFFGTQCRAKSTSRSGHSFVSDNCTGRRLSAASGVSIITQVCLFVRLMTGRNSLHIDSCNTTIGLKSIKYKGPKLWNELPSQLKY